MTADVRVLPSSGLTSVSLRSVRALMDAAFDGDFSDHDWAHSLGGWHALIGTDDDVVAHASVVPRRITIGTRTFDAGFVEAVAVHPDRQRTGLGTAVMTPIDEIIRERFAIGVLSTGEWHFYERLGWARWRGPSFVRRVSGQVERTPDDDDGVMVLQPRSGSRELDLAAPIVCDERAGDSW